VGKPTHHPLVGRPSAATYRRKAPAFAPNVASPDDEPADPIAQKTGITLAIAFASETALGRASASATQEVVQRQIRRAGAGGGPALRRTGDDPSEGVQILRNA
jgi:hypothetical protein